MGLGASILPGPCNLLQAEQVSPSSSAIPGHRAQPSCRLSGHHMAGRGRGGGVDRKVGVGRQGGRQVWGEGRQVGGAGRLGRGRQVGGQPWSLGPAPERSAWSWLSRSCESPGNKWPPQLPRGCFGEGCD